jgi:pimeloyl-ACP methyl ester carboxylesterase
VTVRARSGTIELEYETFGTRASPALLLVAGYAMQLISWDTPLCEMLAAHDLFVIRFDNRDCGLSTQCGSEPYPVVRATTDRFAGREPPPAPYSIVDMANDAFAVLDAIGIETAHVVGASMGGIITQVMAIEHPERVRSLVSVMSSTGEPDYGQGTPATLAALLGPPPSSRDEYVGHMLRISRAAGTKTHFDEARTRSRVTAAFDRSFTPAGSSRQFAALSFAPDRAAALRSLRVPTLVVHGVQDTLVGPSGGTRTAELIPGAELLLLEEAGHDLPVVVWPRLVQAIADHVRAAEQARQAEANDIASG